MMMHEYAVETDGYATVLRFLRGETPNLAVLWLWKFRRTTAANAAKRVYDGETVVIGWTYLDDLTPPVYAVLATAPTVSLGRQSLNAFAEACKGSFVDLDADLNTAAAEASLQYARERGASP